MPDKKASADLSVGLEEKLTAENELEYAQPSAAEKLINYSTLALSMLLLGGSLVFWFIVLKYLLLNPSNLVDASQMSAILVCCAAVPLVVTVIQAALKRAVSVERWLICMCLSGAISSLFIVLYQLCIRHVSFTLPELPTLLCFTVSGCAVPAVIYLGIRILIPKITPYFKPAGKYTRAEWESVRDDILSLTDMK